MLRACELYLHDDLILDGEDIIKINMQKTDVIGIVGLVQNHTNVIGIRNGNVSVLDKDKYLASIMHSQGEICYISRNKSLIIPAIQVFYGIEDKGCILAIYKEKNIRDAKLANAIKTSQVNSIVEDMSSSHQFLQNYNKQKMLRKAYDRLVVPDSKR